MLLLPLFCALAITLAGCAEQPKEIFGEGSSPAPTSSEPSSEDDSGPGNDSSPDVSDTDSTLQDASPAECLVGAWSADNAFFLTAMQQFGDEITGVGGEVVVTFAADGTLTTDYRDWVITADVEGHTTTIRRHGTDSGTYSAIESTIDIADTSMGSTIVLSAAGSDMPFSPEPARYSAATLTCTDSSATITTVDGVLLLNR